MSKLPFDSSAPITRRTVLSGAAALACGALLGKPRQAQAATAIRIVIGYSPGGGIDTIARTIAPGLQAALGQPVVVENRPSGGAILAVRTVVESAPDGNVALVSANSDIALSPSIFKSLPYDPRKDLIAVGPITFTTTVFIVRKDFPAKTVAEFMAYAKSKPPGTIVFGSSGVGSGPNLNGERMMAMAGIKGVHVPHRGGSQAIVEMMAGRIDFMIDSLGLCLPYIQAGNVRALAVLRPTPSPALPDVPPMPEFDATSWQGVFLPAKTPDAIVQRWVAALKSTLADPAVVYTLVGMKTGVVASMSQSEFSQLVATDIERWGQVAKSINFERI